MLLENNLETLLLHFDKGLGSTDETPENNKDISTISKFNCQVPFMEFIIEWN